MLLFCDTSAAVPLLLAEPNSAAAEAAVTQASALVAWRWLSVEVEAALARRRASAASWQRWRTLHQAIRYLDLDAAAYDALNAFNRGLRLRAANAGHLFVFERASAVLPGLALLTFDAEMSAAAERLSMLVWSATEDS